jgi:hypothetical protein
MIRWILGMLKTHAKCGLCVFAKMSDYSEFFLDAQNSQKKYRLRRKVALLERDSEYMPRKAYSRTVPTTSNFKGT